MGHTSQHASITLRVAFKWLPEKTSTVSVEQPCCYQSSKGVPVRFTRLDKTELDHVECLLSHHSNLVGRRGGVRGRRLLVALSWWLGVLLLVILHGSNKDKAREIRGGHKMERSRSFARARPPSSPQDDTVSHKRDYSHAKCLPQVLAVTAADTV